MISEATLNVHSAPHLRHNYVVAQAGQTLSFQDDWACLFPGDAAVSNTREALIPERGQG